MSNPVDDFLLGGGAPTASYKDAPIGHTYKGTILASEVNQQTKMGTGELLFWDDGKPRMQAVVTIQTDLRDPELPDDDGLRTVYLKGGKKRASTEKAAADAVKAAGATQLLVGGTFGLVYTGDGAKTNPAFNAPKEYGATYVPPVAGVDLSAAWDD